MNRNRENDVSICVEIDYFASLREIRGLSHELFSTKARTLASLYVELKCLHNFHLDMDSLRVALNDEFVEWNTFLSDGDKIVFIPPVAGG